MTKEIEAKFLNVDIVNIRNRLVKLGAVLKIPMRMMRRVMIKTQEMANENAFLRIRDEGDKITMTYKRVSALTVDGSEEVEVIVNSFENAIEVMSASGLKYETYQESKREEWLLRDVQVVIDEWPWVNPFVEIEGKNEYEVMEAARLLAFDWNDAVFGSVTSVYNDKYPHLEGTGVQISDIARVEFGKEIPSILLSS